MQGIFFHSPLPCWKCHLQIRPISVHLPIRHSARYSTDPTNPSGWFLHHEYTCCITGSSQPRLPTHWETYTASSREAYGSDPISGHWILFLDNDSQVIWHFIIFCLNINVYALTQYAAETGGILSMHYFGWTLVKSYLTTVRAFGIYSLRLHECCWNNLETRIIENTLRKYWAIFSSNAGYGYCCTEAPTPLYMPCALKKGTAYAHMCYTIYVACTNIRARAVNKRYRNLTYLRFLQWFGI